MTKKVLVAGWFSFEQMGATAGDLLTRDLACEWLRSAGRVVDVAVVPPFTGGVRWDCVDPEEYSHVVFVCGPFGNGPPVDEFLQRFRGRRFIGLNLTMLDPVESWNPFDLLLERDSSRVVRPDLAFLAPTSKAPVVGLILIHPQPEYGDRDRHLEANQSLRALIEGTEAAVVSIDTRLDENSTGLRTAGEIESLVSKMDVVLTTRLHGLVLSLKNGVPVIAVDPVAGGAKISLQAKLLQWPLLFRVDEDNTTRLQDAFSWCLSNTARQEALAAKSRALKLLEDVQDRFLHEFLWSRDHDMS